MPLETWLLYAAAVFVLTVTPGPTVLMCVTNGVNFGARRSFFSALGSITAVVGIMACSALGVGAVLATSGELFNVIKWLGVGYLLYLGITTLRSTASGFDLPSRTSHVPSSQVSRRALYIKGLLVGASNPKALLFFTAFFPQFINPAAPQLLQFLILGGTFICFELFWLMFYATFASRLAPWLRMQGRAKVFNRVSGLTFMGAGVLLATVKRSIND
ncbi:MAG: LysE family translocator [Burkholderiaceae bacterium]|nr:LysE family translocator [Burkholderiaceae bacterium]